MDFAACYKHAEAANGSFGHPGGRPDDRKGQPEAEVSQQNTHSYYVNSACIMSLRSRNYSFDSKNRVQSVCGLQLT